MSNPKVDAPAKEITEVIDNLPLFSAAVEDNLQDAREYLKLRQVEHAHGSLGKAVAAYKSETGIGKREDG